MVNFSPRSVRVGAVGSPLGRITVGRRGLALAVGDLGGEGFEATGPDPAEVIEPGSRARMRQQPSARAWTTNVWRSETGPSRVDVLEHCAALEADRTGCDERLTTHDQDAIDACHRELLDVSCEALCLEGADPCLALFEQDPAAEPPVVHCDHPWRQPAID